MTKPLPAVFAQAEQIELIESGDRCVGWRWNPGGNTRILVLHGFSSSARNFAHLIADLVKQDAEVIAFDAPAHGASEGKMIHSLRYRSFIQSIRRQWGPFDGYTAHSFGGLSISLALEEMAPRSGEKLVLIAPATETRSALDQLRTTLKLRPSIMRQIDRIIEEKSGRPVSWFSVNRAISHLSIPIYWVHDDTDEITPLSDTTPTRERKDPHIRFRITKGLGHRRIYRDASVCREILEFFAPANPS